MLEKPETAEQRILEAAVACIEEFGLKGATIRRIAERAEVNTAAINYYFRTKEQLMDRVIGLTLDNAFDWNDLRDTETLPPKERLFAILEHLTEGAQRFPEITRAHFFEAMVNGNYDAPGVAALNRFMEALFGKLRAKGFAGDDRELRLILAQAFFAGVYSVGTVPNLCRAFLQADLTETENRREYLRFLVDRLMGG